MQNFFNEYKLTVSIHNDNPPLHPLTSPYISYIPLHSISSPSPGSINPLLPTVINTYHFEFYLFSHLSKLIYSWLSGWINSSSALCLQAINCFSFIFPFGWCIFKILCLLLDCSKFTNFLTNQYNYLVFFYWL